MSVINKPGLRKNHLRMRSVLLFSAGLILPALSCLAAIAFHPSASTAASDSNKVKTPQGGAIEHYFLADRNNALVHTLNVSNNTQVGSARAGTNPDAIVISPTGRLAFVANLNSNYISVIDLTINAEIRRLKDLRAKTLALNADGSRLIAPMIGNRQPDEVVIIDTATLAVIQRVSLNGLLGDDPGNRFDISLGAVVVVGNRAYVENESNFPVAIIDINTFAVSTVPGSNVGLALFSSPAIAATPSGNHVVVLKQAPSALLIIDTGTNTVVKNTALPSTPNAIAITRDAADPDGVSGYLVRSSNLISAVNLNPASPNFGQIVSGASLPAAFGATVEIALTADSNRAYVASASTTSTNNVAVVDTGLLITNPATALINQFRVGATLRAVAVDFTDTMPPADAPIVTSLSLNTVVNSAPTTIQINGSGFAAGAFVRFGNLDPVPATFLSPNLIEATIPQYAAAQVADVIVTKPNLGGGGAGQNPLSGILIGQLTINNPASFQPTNRVFTTNFGEGNLSGLNLATTLMQPNPISFDLMGLAFTPDGQRIYVDQFSPGAVRVFNVATGMVEATIPVGNTTLGQADGIAVAPNPATGKPVALVVSGIRTGVNIDEQLSAIDADPTSPTFNTVIDTLNAGLTNAAGNRGALAVTPNGRYVYSNGFGTPEGRLLIFDRVGRTVTILLLSSLGGTAFQSHMHVTPDGQSLLLVDLNGNIKVLDIGANPLSPTLVATITGVIPGGLDPLFLNRFQVEGNRLFAYDSVQHVVEVFNFNRATADYSVLGTFVIPGTPDLLACGFGVLPGGAFIYAALVDDGAVAVVDTAKVIAADPGALLTKVATGLSPFAIAISPRPVADLAVSAVAPPAMVATGANITYSYTITNTGLDTAQTVTLTDNLPPEVSFVSCSSTGGVCGGSANSRNVTFTSLAPGAVATATFLAVVNCSVPSGTTFNNSASINSLTPDVNPSNNSTATMTTALNLTISPTDQVISSRGGSANIDIAAPCGTNWTAISNESWIIIVSNDSGTGSGVVAIETRENFNEASRTGTLSIGGRTYTLRQAGAAQVCSIEISALFSSFSAAGGVGTINVTSPVGCVWSATGQVDWIVITSGNSGTGNGAINYTVKPNTTGSARKGSIKVSGRTHNVKQKGG
jgi:uncharacterized repeat protein (TIGR01451 family)